MQLVDQREAGRAVATNERQARQDTPHGVSGVPLRTVAVARHASGGPGPADLIRSPGLWC